MTQPRRQRSMVVLCRLLAIACLASLAGAARAVDVTGQKIYQTHCQSCHGDHGQGVKDEYPDPLIGTRSLASLTAYIDKRMPEGAPDKVNGKDAVDVSKYVYGAFYSPSAQAKKNPPRIELSRLTAGQHRNAMADLIASFTPAPQQPKAGKGAAGASGAGGPSDEQRGLKAEFSNGPRRFREDKVVLTRVDPSIDFDFGAAGPGGPVAKDEFAVRWTGGLHAPQDGPYEIVVTTKSGMRLWLNDETTPLMDAWVRSGDSFEYRETVYLLGGRTYPIRLEIFKEKKEKGSGITLKWKRPLRQEEAIPAAAMSPGKLAPTFVARAPFPPDDRSMGYERGTFISKAWDEASTDAAMEAVAHVVARLPELAGSDGRDGNAKKALPQFALRFAERAFRRPLTPEQQAFFVDRHFASGADLELALRKSLLLTLKSPRFLYHEAGLAPEDAHTVAARMAFALWDSIPDKDLAAAARDGKLATREGMLAQVQRMMGDPRAKAKLNGFFNTWLSLDRLHELSKDSKAYPGFDQAVVADLRTSLELFLDEVVGGEGSDYRKLMLADEVWLNGRLAAFYGVDLPKDAPFQKVKVPHRAGVITHPLLMAGFAYSSASSPIHRGVFVSRNLLGRRLRPPPEAVAPLSVDAHPDMTTRERTALQTSEKTCMSCHSMINPLGFTFENYDAVGRYRAMEKAKPVDATGSYHTAAGDVVSFKGAAELGAFLVRSEEAQSAFVERLFHHVAKQPILAFGYDQHEKLRAYFVRHEYNIKALLAEMVVAACAANSPAPAPVPPPAPTASAPSTAAPAQTKSKP